MKEWGPRSSSLAPILALLLGVTLDKALSSPCGALFPAGGWGGAVTFSDGSHMKTAEPARLGADAAGTRPTHGGLARLCSDRDLLSFWAEPSITSSLRIKNI